jgi:hypothetical protein
MAVTILSIPILALKRSPFMIFIGDKLEKGRDYDFRMKFIYQELRERELTFVEFVRSLESWKVVLKHAFTRMRPVIYSEAVSSCGRLLSRLSRKSDKFDPNSVIFDKDPETQFKQRVATHYLGNINDDIWSISIMKWILRAVGVRAAFIVAANERNFHAVLGCKLNSMPTVGILHGIAHHHYIVYDFMAGYEGEKSLSVDKYGLWSQWLKDYYLKNSRAYRREQLYVSGLMRPLEGPIDKREPILKSAGPIKVLFISEQLAAPQEVMPYFNELLKDSAIEVAIKFRPYRDGFEEWLLGEQPDFLKKNNLKILRGSIQDAVKMSDVIVGSNSTAVLEALLQSKIPILFNTSKWGDSFSLREYGKGSFFAETPEELIKKIKETSSVSPSVLLDLCERYFGDPYQNGSAWVVDQLEAALKGCFIK